MPETKQKSWKEIIISVVIAFIFIIILSLILRYFEDKLEQQAQAAAVDYRAKIITYRPSAALKLNAGSTTILKIKYLNSGRTAWLNSGSNAVIVKTDNGDDFAHSSWFSTTKPTKLYYPKISQGEPIWFEIPVKIPKTNGLYPLKFSLWAGGTKINGGTAEFKITVFGGKEANRPASSNEARLAPPERQEMFKITSGQKNKLPIIIEPTNNTSFQIKSNGDILAQKIGEKIQIDFDFNLKRYFINNQAGQRMVMTDQPLKFTPADLTANFKLTDDQEYNFCANLEFVYQSENQSLAIFSDGPIDCQPKLIRQLADQQFWQSISPEINIPEDYRFQEPIIRVGLFYQTVDEQSKLPIKIKTFNQEPYSVKTSKDHLLTRATAGDLLEIDYDFKLKRYFLNANGQRLAMTDEPLRFIADNPEAIFEIASWQNGPFWGMNVNDNDYRGSLEIQYNPSTERLWLINELPMEKYMRGIMEVWDTWPYEFLKAQKIAARTYAMFRYLNPKYTNTPNEEPIFTLRATQADQVYRGYQAESRNPNIVRAVEETRGMIAVYNNNPILAYYFAQTDGQTRDSYQARMTTGPVDYLKARPDPPGEGRTLKGHGVGLPQQGGKVAAEQGANFSQILKYYYLGIEIKKLYPVK